MDSIEANRDAILGEGLMQQAQSHILEGQAKYAEEVTAISDYNAEIFTQGVDLARELAGSHMQAAEQRGEIAGQGQADPALASSFRYRIFITQGMPDEEIRNLVSMYSGRSDVALVLRGMRPGQHIDDVLGWMHRMVGPVSEGMSAPTFILDPKPFTDLGVDQAPVIARYDDAKLIAFALGMTSSSWLEERVASGGKGNLGVYGPTVTVVEEDIIKALMERAAAYDWKGSGESAIKRFWARTEAHALPRVTSARSFVLDPTVVIAESIIAPDGTVIARAGDMLNPLEAMPFHNIFAFFDPADAEQVSWARALVAANHGRLVTLMATQLRSLDNLADLQKLSSRIGTRVYSLPAEVKERFHIERVPTVVTAEGTVFIIEEQLPTQRPKE